MLKLRSTYKNIKERFIEYPEVNIGYAVIYVNSFCNAKCIMCDIGQRSGEGIDILRSSEKYLSLDTLSKVLNDPILEGRKITFSLLMTEPLLSPNIFEIISFIKKHGHVVDLTTNGILLLEKADCLIDSGLDSIQISIDGPPNVHDLIRGVKGTYQKATDGIKALTQKAMNSKRQLEIRINYTVTNLNCQYLESFADMINKDFNIDLLKFQFMDFVSEEMKTQHNKIFPIKQCESSISKEVDPELVDIDVLAKQIKNIKKKEFDRIKKVQIIPDLLRYDNLKKYFNKRGDKLIIDQKCYLPFHQFAVKTNGDILLHMRCLDYTLGNIHNGKTIKQIYKSKKAQYFWKELKSADYCFPVCTRCCGSLHTLKQYH